MDQNQFDAMRKMQRTTAITANQLYSKGGKSVSLRDLAS